MELKESESPKVSGMVYIRVLPSAHRKNKIADEKERKSRTLLAKAVIHSHSRSQNADDWNLIHEDLDPIDDQDRKKWIFQWQIAMTVP
ncbi:hypothetical protein Tco_1042913 [Tanacetum coccineum]|uniref:Uncharacterized protein n=1 Tax=Tanacetum coccineum TaxID=301880 RepID=A0ABQ5GKZ5_9ASTR